VWGLNGDTIFCLSDAHGQGDKRSRYLNNITPNRD